MANLTLGLDLGPTSLGWALIDENQHKLIATGVRAFPEGVDRDPSGAEISKNEQRRIARGTRRQTARRARRKRKLREALVEAGLLPPLAMLPNDDPQRIAWERDEFRKNGGDPISLRSRVMTERLEPFELGRVFIHLNQRRGFKSNRKTDRSKKKESSEILDEISDLAAQMGERTLGEELARRRGDDPGSFHLTRIRGLHTHRDMYEREFAAIWAAQQKHHPNLLTDVLREQVHRIIFFQRPLLPPSVGLVGRCELEPRLPRCPRADRRAQRLRLYQEVNNLRVLDTAARTERTLAPEEREKLIGYLFKAKDRTFDQIRKHLFEQHASIQFNLEAGGRTKLKGLPTDAALARKGMLGPKWHKLPEELKDRIVAAIIDDEEDRLRHLLVEGGLDSELALTLLDQVNMEDGYASYSLFAIKKLLPHLERGLPLTSRDEQTPCALRAAGYVMPWEYAAETQPYLPEPPNLTNPLVRQALFEVRKVVNAILRELVYRPGHRLARIHIELAREARGTAEQRRKRSLDMHDRERERDTAAGAIREANIKPTRDAIDRYLLWKEQEQVCVYSGRSISFAQLLGGEVDIDHIMPRGRSLDNSLMNRVVAFRAENARKGDRTPHEWLAKSDPEKYEQVLQRARQLPYPKLRRFYQESVELGDFFARQLVDTTYITTQVYQYVCSLGADVLCIRGQHTAELRRHWGLNTVLRHDQLDLKNRDDHRHHAVDAIVIALTGRSRLQQLARIYREGGTETTGEILPEPWQDFRADVELAVNNINVSHRPRRRVSGGLHEDTLYGRTNQPDIYVLRKPLEALSLNEIEKIRDPGIRRIVSERVRNFGLDPGRGKGSKIPADVWKERLRMPSGVPIRRVRLLKPDKSVVPIRGGATYVKPGEQHHVEVFELELGGKTKRYGRFVTRLEAYRRIRNRIQLVQKTDPENPAARFIMSLCTGDMLWAEFDGQERLVVVQTLVSTQPRAHIVDANDARPSTKKRNVGKRIGALRARKVTVDPLGRIRWAND